MGEPAQWRNVLWYPTPAQAIPRGWSLSNWADYAEPYFAFSERRIPLTLTASSDTVEVGQLVYFTANTPASGLLLWDFGDGSQRSGSAQQQYAYSQLGTYLVQVAAENACAASAQRMIVVVAPFDIYVPNSFTPNADGINDTWYPAIRGGVKSLRWRLYDRWGLLIATGENVTARWDGTKDGKPCPEGAYAYVIEVETLTGKKVLKSGTITLLR